MKTRNIGFDIKPPKKACEDQKCPFHGNLKVRGRTITGTIVKLDIHNTGTLELERTRKIPKYERYEKIRSRLRFHNPSCLEAKVGDKVTVMECKPLSKTKKFVAVKKLGEDIIYKQKVEGMEESKQKTKEKVKEEDTKKVEEDASDKS